MNKIIKQFLSILLVLVFVINLFPLNVLASELSRGDNLEEILATIDPSNDIDEDDPVVAPPTYIQEIPVEVVEEDLSRRSEYYKEFVLNNGLRLAAIYPDAIHYEDDGQWKEIDNTLTAKVVNGQAVYTNTAGLWDVRFPQQLTNSNAISITKDGYTVSFGMAGEMRTSGDLVVASANLQMEADSASTLAVQTAMTSTAQIQQSDIASIKAAAKFEETVPDKLYAKLLYPAVYNGTNIVYDLSSNQLKESIIIPRYDATLWGYRYELDTGGLVPVLNEDQSIDLCDPVTSDIVMTMPAPFMLDADEAYCEDVAVTLVQKGNVYLLSYHLPRQWLEEEARVWPVILDPIVNANNERTNIQDITVAENSTESNNAPTIKCGYHLTHGIFRTYLRYKTLPALCSADVIHSATIQLTKPYDSDLSAPIEVHKVKAPWEASETSWSNKPAFDSTIEDITTVQGPAQYSWDVTDIVYGWYADTANALQNNTGMLFKASNAIETGGTKNWQQFCSSDFGSDRPVLTIEYRESNGLEDYWDYTSSSAGRAGTGYVQNHSGNLVWVHSDIGFDGNRMPVSISHIYNAHDASSNPFGMGNGWRTNFNQTLSVSTGEGSYVWEDGDGTIHEFVAASSGATHVDREGLGLTLTVSSDGYSVADKYGNTSVFNASGRLTKQLNNQAAASRIEITYDSASPNLISEILDATDRRYAFTYENSLLKRIDYYGHKSNTTILSTITFGYTDSNLISITYRDQAVSAFSYTTKNLLSSVTDIDGYIISYTYNTLVSDKPSRVVSITESDASPTGELITGASTTIDYSFNRTTLTDLDNNVQTLFFNEWGNTISSQDNEGNATFFRYATDITSFATRHRRMAASQQQDTVVNLIKDHSFESGTKWTAITAKDTCTIFSDDAYLGSKSLKITCDSFIGSNGACSGTYSALPGESYTFSAYVKCGSTEVMLAIEDDQGNFVDSGIFYENTPSINPQWHRLEVTYTNETTETRTIQLFLRYWSSGTVYLDCVQLENSEGASRYNMIEDSDLSSNVGSSNSKWVIYSNGPNTPFGSGGATAPGLTGGRILIQGCTEAEQYIGQTLYLSGQKGDAYVFSGWITGVSLPDNGSSRHCGLKLSFSNTDGTTTDFSISTNPHLKSQNEWQYLAGAATAEKAYYAVTLKAEFNNNANYVIFDGIQLFKEEYGETYSYDGYGNVTKVIDAMGQSTDYTYDSNNDLIETLFPTNIKIKNEYDLHHNVEKSEKQYELYNEENNSLEWITVETDNYVYDDFGNVTEHTSTAGGVTKSTSATYTTNGNFLCTATDAAGNMTEYSYNLNDSTLTWVEYPEDTEDTRTYYKYDKMFRLEETTAHTDTGNDLSAQYAYNGDLLSSITTPSTTYSLAYGDFALRTGVSIGNRTLASYAYTEDYNHYLEQLDYGNGDVVKYSYDKLGRVTQEAYYENGSSTASRTITYDYDNTGALATMKDSETGITTRYYYDTVGHLTAQLEANSAMEHSLRYTYNDLGQVVQLREYYKDNGDDDSEITFTDFTYEHNRVTSVVNNNATKNSTADDISEDYSYDYFERITEKVTCYGSSNVLTETVTYSKTSNQVTQLAIDTSAYDTTYQYTYDGNGNILSVNALGNTTTYVYDSANQLIRENNRDAYKTWVWTYDNAGNITSKKEYAYTTGTLGAVLDTIIYEYGDASWGDLLTKYDGKGITYDTIGNPAFDGNWNYTWEQGRQLASMSYASNTWLFTYDANGMRTGRSNQDDVYTYIYNGSQLSRMTYGDDVMRFTYGADGSPLSINYNGTTYYYVLNLQGDVVQILNSSGAQVVYYTYDAWGRLLTTTGSMSSTLGVHNPLRYRGYVYDRETGLYYVQSRYYNPTIGRWINADSVIAGNGENILGYNMFAYCFNNPVNMSDPTGNWPSWSTVLKAAAIAVTAVAVVAVVAATVATFGATSIAATIVVSSAITIATKATEVAVLQGKKSASEGKDTGQVVTDIIESVFDNGVGTVAKTAVTKTAGYATGFYSQSSSFQDVMKLQKMDGYNLKTLAGAATYEISNRFTDLNYCVSAKASTGSMLISYGSAGLNVVNTVISIFADDPVQRATSRGYKLK